MSNVDFERNWRESARWRILRVIYAGAPWPVMEGLLQAALDDAHLRVSPAELRKQLVYLRDKGLLVIHQEDQATWLATLSSLGTDVAEYSAPAPAGIHRPNKWFE
jgi:hypothetical protein